MGRLTKAKSEATTRARTAVENEFITQGVASATSRKCDEYYQNYGDLIADMTLEKIKGILGPEFFEKYKSEELDFALAKHQISIHSLLGQPRLTYRTLFLLLLYFL